MASIVSSELCSARRASNLAASFAFVSLAFLSYRYSPHTARLRDAWHESLQLTGNDALTLAYVLFGIGILFFYLRAPSHHESRALSAVNALLAIIRSPNVLIHGGLRAAERLGLLTVLLKGFFCPLMILYLCGSLASVLENGAQLSHEASLPGSNFLHLFNAHGFWFLFQLTLLIDVGYFTVGYVVEHPALGNEIRSVDPSWTGWAVTLACYPPFNGITVKILGGNVADFPQFGNPLIHLTLNGLLLFAMAVYASASVALKWKASNLTHRGIVSSGPYRYVRHPAYVAKNLAWWIASTPAFLSAAEHSWWNGLLVVGAAAAWSALYALRALTEEDHLKSVDGEYASYCELVRFRFIPGVY